MDNTEKSANNHRHNFWFVSENLRATAAVLSRLYARIHAYSGDYTKAPDLVQLFEGLLANIEKLIEATMAIEDVSPATTRDILTASMAIRRKMRYCKSELERCSNGHKVNMQLDNPKTIYELVINKLEKDSGQYTLLQDLRDKVEAESMLQSGKVDAAQGKSKEKPPNLMVLTIIPKHFDVSERTLRRLVKNKKLKKYPDKSGTVFLDIVEVAKRYQRKS